MKKLLFILLLAGCGGAAAPDRPAWIDFPSGACAANEFCAVGIGENMGQAKTDARLEILKWFQSEIKSNASFAESDKGSSASIAMFESADGVIEGTSVKETYFDSENHYAMAVLDKIAAADKIKLKIYNLDDKMKALASEKKGGRELTQFYEERRVLNEQVQFLSGESVPEVVKYADVLAARSFKGVAYSIEIDDRQIAAIVGEVLSENGASVGKSGKKIVGKFSATEIPVNVPGFVKYQFYLKLGQAEIFEYETGRSKEQATTAVMPKMKAFIEGRIYEIAE